MTDYPEGTSVTGLLGLIKSIATSTPMNMLGAGAEFVARVGKYFGMDAKLANEIDMGREIQLFLEGKRTRTDVEKRAVADFLNFEVVQKLRDNGWGDFTSALVGGVVSMLGGWITGPLVGMADKAIVAPVLGMITGGDHTDSATAQSVGTRRTSELGATN